MKLLPRSARPFALLRRHWELALSILAAVVGLGLQLAGWHTALHWELGSVALLLCIPLLVRVWDELQHGNYGVNVLGLVGIISAELLHQYWTALVICLMMGVERLLAAYAERRSHAELTAWQAQTPQLAHVLRGRKVVEVAASSLLAGDKVVIQSGEVVPVDARILEGSSNFDESLVAGSDAPLARGPQDDILAGSINLGGPVSAKASHSLADSQFQQLLELRQSADARQAPLVRQLVRWSLPFTVAVLAAGGVLWWSSHHAVRFLEVVVVATPGPLLLAAPIALLAGLDRAGKRGITVRSAGRLQKLAQLQTLAFGKTGILTAGQPQVADIVAIAPYTKNEVLTMAASLEQSSGHSLARAIVAAAAAKHLSYTKAKHVLEIPGQGVRAMFRGKEVMVGQPALLAAHDVPITTKLRAKQTASYLAVGGEVIGVISFHDELRPNAKGLLARLRQLKVRHFLLVSGDTLESAQAVAKPLGIKQVYAAMTPRDKLTTLEKLDSRSVGFVGDGVQDAPLLTAADIGIALGARGSVPATESADVILMPDDLDMVAEAVAIARRSVSVAQQSVIIGMALSVGLVAAFATGKFPALLGVALQGILDLLVIASALRAARSY